MSLVLTIPQEVKLREMRHRALLASWEEAKHPREDDGKFAETEGGGNDSDKKAEISRDDAIDAYRAAWKPISTADPSGQDTNPLYQSDPDLTAHERGMWEGEGIMSKRLKGQWRAPTEREAMRKFQHDLRYERGIELDESEKIWNKLKDSKVSRKTPRYAPKSKARAAIAEAEADLEKVFPTDTQAFGGDGAWLAMRKLIDIDDRMRWKKEGWSDAERNRAIDHTVEEAIKAQEGGMRTLKPWVAKRWQKNLKQLSSDEWRELARKGAERAWDQNIGDLYKRQGA